ncbi:MAG: sigma-54-dependent Fis family transcriptional regulator [Desulfomonile tiedjei]|nr:sigma-54-dependent Fis family transcriptional regulator [Desulfomonile tiedjei]
MRLGASDYLTKPFEPDELLLSVSNALRERLKDEEISLLRKSVRRSYLGDATLGASGSLEPDFSSEAIRRALAKARNAAATDTIVLLLGESGSGKDYLARYIHDHSRRSDGPFFTVNCAAVSTDLSESELFGHEPGAFTGARGRKRGLLELAQGGTLLLNEVGDLSPVLQAKLLTFLDTRSFTRVGGEASISVNARLIAATNKPLDQEVAEGRFREDLYYRLNVFAITVPPLRERTEDIPVLVRQIQSRLAAEMGLSVSPSQIDQGVLDVLMGHSWPGNVRELSNLLERALILSHDGRIRLSSLDFATSSEDWSVTVRFPKDRSIHEVSDSIKRSLIMEALRRAAGNKQSAARLLKISRHALAHQMKSLGMSERKALQRPALLRDFHS